MSIDFKFARKGQLPISTMSGSRKIPGFDSKQLRRLRRPQHRQSQPARHPGHGPETANAAGEPPARPPGIRGFSLRRRFVFFRKRQEWLHAGSLSIPGLRVWQYALPGNAEIDMMLLLGTRHEALVPLVNVYAAIVPAVACYAIASRIVKGNGNAAIAVTAIVLSLPIVEFQTFSAYVDLFGTAFLMAGVIRGINRKPRRPMPADKQSQAFVDLCLKRFLC